MRLRATKMPLVSGTNGKFGVVYCPGSAGRTRQLHESKLASPLGNYAFKAFDEV